MNRSMKYELSVAKKLTVLTFTVCMCLNGVAQYYDPYSGLYNSAYQLGSAIGSAINANQEAKARKAAYDWNESGNSYQSRGDYYNAINAYRNSLNIVNDPVVWCNLGWAYANYGDYANARICFNNVPYGHGSYSLAQDGLRTIATKEAEAAREAARKKEEAAQQEKRNKAVEWNNKGVAYYNEDNYSSAITAFRNALDYDNDATYWHHLGMAYYSNGDYENAKTAFRKVPYGHKNYDKAQEYMAQIDAKSNQELLNKITNNMVQVQGGTFKMGTLRGQTEHSVTVSSFKIGKYEVTQAEWQAVMGTSLRQQRDKEDSRLSLAGEGGNYPMYYVSWYEAVEFCNKLSAMKGLSKYYNIGGTTVTTNPSANGFRLPTEAEWEYAARGGSNSMGYTYSGSSTIGDVAWYYENSGDYKLSDTDWDAYYLAAEGTAAKQEAIKVPIKKASDNNNRTHTIGMKKANELGLYDMSGNVYEWCWDWYGDYTAVAQTNPKGATSGSERVVRGGSWYFVAWYARVSQRVGYAPDRRYYGLGFRLACNSN